MIIEPHIRTKIEKDLVCDVDGFYKYWPSGQPGYLDEGALMIILHILKEKNAAWEADINQYFESQPKEQ